jgi:hypothetical protein
VVRTTIARIVLFAIATTITVAIAIILSSNSATFNAKYAGRNFNASDGARSFNV